MAPIAMPRHVPSGRGSREPVPARGPFVPIGAFFQPPSVSSLQSQRWARLGFVSLFIHALGVGALTMLFSRSVTTEPPDELTVGMVFEAPKESASPGDPPSSPQPEVPPAAAPQPATPEALIALPAPELQPPELASAPVFSPEAPSIPAELPPAPTPMTATPVSPTADALLTPPKPAPRTPAPRQRAVIEAPPRPSLPRPQAAATTARTAPGPAIAPSATPVAPTIDPLWRASIARWLDAHKTYPEAARRRGEEGLVTVRFTVDRSGRVLDPAITETSGSERLDTATLALLRGATLAAFPAGMPQPQITINTAVRYNLR